MKGRKSRKKSSARWLQRQSDDYYVKQALKLGWRSRAVFKLQQIDERYGLLSGGGVIDLGAAPGGWSQYAVSRVGAGKVVAVDKSPMEPIDGVHIVQGDCFHADIPHLAADFFGETPITLVLSDMSPNITGNSSIDVPGSLELAEYAAEFAADVLASEGRFLVKVLQGAGFNEYVAELKKRFASVRICKPAASRQQSREVYVLAQKLTHNGR